MPDFIEWPAPLSLSLAEWLRDIGLRARLEREILPGYLTRCRWYRSKARTLISAAFETWAHLSPAPSEASPMLTVVRVNFAGAESERYALPLIVVPGEKAKGFPESAVLGRFRCGEKKIWLCDACYDSEFRAELLNSLQGKADIPLAQGLLRGEPSPTWKRSNANPNFASRVLGAEQSNTGMAFSSGSFLKLYRRLESGVHPEPEVLRFLQEQTRFRGVPEFQSVLQWEWPEKPPTAVALLQRFIEAGENGWEYALQNLASLPPSFLNWIDGLGRNTAELHQALGSRADIPDFAPELLSSEDLAVLQTETENLLARTMDLLQPQASAMPATSLARQVLDQRGVLASKTGLELKSATAGQKIRVHGDFHLGQVLCAAGKIWFLDFEGETSRPLAEKRRRHSPLRDVAGMLRSLHYAVHVAARTSPEPRAAADALETRHRLLSARYLDAYYAAMLGSDLLPEITETRDALLRLFILEKAVYELDYELNNRPDWVEIPLQGLLALSKN